MSEPPLGVAVPDTRLHPIYLIIGTAKTLRQAIPYLVVTVFAGASWWVIAALFTLAMAIAIAQWYVKKYAVVGGMLLLRSGLVDQSVRVVPVARITALAAFQSLTQRIVGVWELTVQLPGDRNGSTLTLTCLSGRRLGELRAALESGGRTTVVVNPESSPGSSTIQRYLSWRRTSATSAPTHGPEVIAVLTTFDMLIAALTNGSIWIILLAVLTVWFQFSEYVPSHASQFMNQIVEPQGVYVVLLTLVAVAIAAGLALGALRLHRFTLVRDDDVLHTSRGLLGKETATISVSRVQAVRVVEGFWRILLGYCGLQVEVAGIGRLNANQRMLFPLVRTDRAESLIRRALPEMPWPSQPLLALPARVHRRYLTLPLEYAMGFTLLMLFLPGWWKLLAILPLPLGCALGVARAREARWWVDDQSVVLRWRRLLNRNTVIAHRGGSQLIEFSSSPMKAKAGVAGLKIRFSSGRGAGIRYMVDSDAYLLLRAVGRVSAQEPAHTVHPR
jgi:putative membrane protein